MRGEYQCPYCINYNPYTDDCWLICTDCKDNGIFFGDKKCTHYFKK